MTTLPPWHQNILEKLLISEKLDKLECDLFEIVHNNINIANAIKSEIEEYTGLNDLNIVKYLNKLHLEVNN